MDESPRKAIFQWLAKAEEKLTPASCLMTQSDHRHAADEQANIASHLKLYTPFRQIENSFRKDRMPATEQLKRKRLPQSDSSADHAKAIRRPKVRHRPANASDKSCFPRENGEDGAVVVDPIAPRAELLEEGQRLFEKRRRHKTRPDRYVLNEHRANKVKPKRQEKESAETRPKKIKRKEKAGAALVRDFSAVNFASDRLTLKPSGKVGLFTKGRASSPFRRKGLHDLSFSELKFHSGHGFQSDEPPKELERPQNKSKAKGLGMDEEFSRFFRSREAVPQAQHPDVHVSKVSRPSPVQHQERQHLSHSNLLSFSQPSVPPFELSGRPFLGFGKRATYTDSTPHLVSALRASSSPLKAYGKVDKPSMPASTSFFRAPITPLRPLRRGDQDKATQVSPFMQNCRRVHDQKNVDRAFRCEDIARPYVNDRSPISPIQTISKLFTDGETKRQEPGCQENEASVQGSKSVNDKVDQNQTRELLEDTSKGPRPVNKVEQMGSKTTQETDFVHELGNLLPKWSRSDFRVTADLKSALEQNAEQSCKTPDDKGKNEDIARATQAEITDEFEVHRQPRSPPPISDAASDSNAKSHSGTEISASGLEEIQERIGMADTQQQDSGPRTQRPDANQLGATALDPINSQSHMPFRSNLARSAVPHLFMSPDSIYQRQMEDPDTRPTTSRILGPCSPFWLSPAAAQRPVLRSIWRPSSRSFTNPNFARPCSAMHDFNLGNRTTNRKQAAIPEQNQYLTPSFSATSPSVKKTDSRTCLSPNEQSRFFACLTSEDIVPEAFWQNQVNLQSVQTHAALDDVDIDAWQTEHCPTEAVNVDEMGETVFVDNALGPREDTSVDRTITGAGALMQNVATLDEDLPGNFWAPNKLY